MNFEFTEVGAEREQPRPLADAEMSAADTEQQAQAGQELHGATSAARLADGRDHDALAGRGDAARAGDNSSSEVVGDGHAGATDDVRPSVRLRLVDATGADGHQDSAAHTPSADRPDKIGSQLSPYPEHVRVFRLTSHEVSDVADPMQRTGADTPHGDQDDLRHEAAHEGADTESARRFATDMTGRTTVETGDAGHSREDAADEPSEADGETGHEAAEDTAEEAASEGKNAVARALGGALRVTGRVISGTSSKALEAYRNGPGEHMLEDQLEKRAQRVGKQALRAHVREAKRGAPLLERRYAANNIKYHAGAEIMQRAKREFKEQVRESWRADDANVGEDTDDQEA